MFKKYFFWLVFIFIIPTQFVFAEELVGEDALKAELTAQILYLTQVVEDLQTQVNNHLAVQQKKYIYDSQEIISNSVTWLKNAQESNVHFNYEYLPFLYRYLEGDNIVRQAGTLYELGEVFSRDNDNVYELEKNIDLSISYFLDNTISGSYNGYSFRCIKKDDLRCSLGATSLALVGIIDGISHSDKLLAKYSELARDYKNFLLAMKKEKEGFRTYFYTKGNQKESQSPFSTGEAFLALARYNIFDKNKDITDVLDNTFEYFKTDDIRFDTSLYLWAMAGVKTLFMSEQKEEFVSFVKEVTARRVAPYINYRNSTRNRGGYVEGLASAYTVLSGNLLDSELSRYEEEINFWLDKISILQVKEDFTMSVSINNGEKEELVVKDAGKAVGGFLSGLNEPVQRIDFTQHSLSAYLQKYVDIDGNKIK